MDLSTTGFIDIVFLLLIFFLLTSALVLPEKQVASNLAVRDRDSASQRSDLEPAVILIRRVPDGVVFQVGGFSTTTESELIEFLNEFINKGDGAYVRAGDEIPFKYVAQAVAACRTTGFEIVTYVPDN